MFHYNKFKIKLYTLIAFSCNVFEMATINENSFYTSHPYVKSDRKKMCTTSPEHPMTSLLDKAKSENLDVLSIEFAEKMDSESKTLRSEFHYPKMSDLPESKFSHNKKK